MKRDIPIEIGRVVQVNFGEDAGKIAVVVDVVDGARALVHGPSTGVDRMTIPLRNLSVTPMLVKIGRGARQASLLKAMEKADVVNKWNQTAWAKKLARQQVRANLNDFQRFQVMIHKKKRNSLIARAVGQLKRAERK